MVMMVGIDDGDWSGPGSSSTSLLLGYSTFLPEFSFISPAPLTSPHLYFLALVLCLSQQHLRLSLSAALRTPGSSRHHTGECDQGSVRGPTSFFLDAWEH